MNGMVEYELIDVLDSNLPRAVYKIMSILLDPVSSTALRQWGQFLSLQENIPLSKESSFYIFYGLSYSFIKSHWGFIQRLPGLPHRRQYWPLRYCDAVPIPEYHVWWARYYFFVGHERCDAKSFEQSQRIYRKLANEAKNDEEKYRYLRGALLAWCEYALLEKDPNSKDFTLPHPENELWNLCKNSNEITTKRARTCRVLAYVLHRFYSHNVTYLNKEPILGNGKDLYEEAKRLYKELLWDSQVLDYHEELFPKNKLPPHYSKIYNVWISRLNVLAPILTFIGIVMLVVGIALFIRNISYLALPNTFVMIIILLVSIVVILAYARFIWYVRIKKTFPRPLDSSISGQKTDVERRHSGMQWTLLFKQDNRQQEYKLRPSQSMYIHLNPCCVVSSEQKFPSNPGIKLTLKDSELLVEKASAAESRDHSLYVLDEGKTTERQLNLNQFQERVPLPAILEVRTPEGTVASIEIIATI